MIKKVINLIAIIAVSLLPILGNAHPADAQNNSWQVKGIDTQIVSKCWQNVPEDSIAKQIAILKGLNVNHVAIGTPYDRPTEMAKWTKAIHAAGLNVWFRSHWLNWEGDEGQAKNMTPSQYIVKTRQFIMAHPDLFSNGDAFTMNVEAENVGVGAGKPFADWNVYRNFLAAEIDQSNIAFAAIGKQNIKTNWLSMNGWVAENELNTAIVEKMGQLTLDHYTPQMEGNRLIPTDQMAAKMGEDLDRIYQKWQKPILIGEWGYNIANNVSDSRQLAAVMAVFEVFKKKPYIIGACYWDHMGNNTRILNDKNGTPTTLRPAADVLRYYFGR